MGCGANVKVAQMSDLFNKSDIWSLLLPQLILALFLGLALGFRSLFARLLLRHVLSARDL